jgi:hypothetical protein
MHTVHLVELYNRTFQLGGSVISAATPVMGRSLLAFAQLPERRDLMFTWCNKELKF